MRVKLHRHRDVVAKDQQTTVRIKTAPSGTRQVDFRPGVRCSIYRGRVTIDIARPVDAEGRAGIELPGLHAYIVAVAWAQV